MKILVFGVAALLAGISGIMLTSQVSSVYPGLMTGYEINAIAAVVVGGTKLMGSAGEGSGWQTLVGAIVLAVIANALIVTGVSGYLQQFVTGLIIILATLRTSRERIIK
jgi:ribose transport system permease protein